MKTHNYIIRLTFTALFAAIIMLTTLLYIPVGGGGYIHPGDAMIYACAWFLGPLAAIAAAVGSMFADIISGYAIYAPATFIIKGLMGLAVGLMMKMMPGKIWTRILAMVAGSIIMIVGYFGFEFFTISNVSAYAGVPWNLVQAAAGIIIGALLIEAFTKVNGITNFRTKLKGDK